MASHDYTRRGLAELIGTFALVFVVGAAVVDNDVLATAFAYGLVLAVFSSAFSHVSGGHFNPAVTIAHLVTRRITGRAALVYVAAQLAGAALGALFVEWIFPVALDKLYAGAPLLNPNIDSFQGFVIEALLTAFVVFVVFATRVDRVEAFAPVSGLLVGLAVAGAVLMGARFTGGAMNPARAFGPELASGHWSHFWVWALGPLVGACAAAVLYDRMFSEKPAPAPRGRRN